MIGYIRREAFRRRRDPCRTCFRANRVRCRCLPVQVMFVAPAATREEALELAQRAPALRVRPRVIERWVRFLTGTDQGQRWAEVRGGAPAVINQDMMRFLNSQRDDFVLPEPVLRRALHATNADQARLLLDAFNRDRAGYAATRSGHADDPAQQDDGDDVAEWALPDDVGRGEIQRPSLHLATIVESPNDLCWDGRETMRDALSRILAVDIDTCTYSRPLCCARSAYRWARAAPRRPPGLRRRRVRSGRDR